MGKKLVVIGLLGTTLDQGQGHKRWERWRPTVSLFQHEDLLISRFELLHPAAYSTLARAVANDIRSVSPETEVVLHQVDLDDPWDFEEVFETLHAFASGYEFDVDSEDYLIHITTGTHVAQICLFLLTETRYFPARLLQCAPPRRREGERDATYRIIDLDLSRYDRLASRFEVEQQEARSFLKAGIDTRNGRFNQLIERIEQVSIASVAPMLLTGPTGAGKTLLARRIYALKRSRRLVSGELVEVNCATLRGDAAMSTLFGHVKGAFTGAIKDRPGLMRAAHNGLLFLDEIGELGLDEQAMLLRAIETGTFLPTGADREASSKFQLIAGTNRDLWEQVQKGEFREDLLARINLWTFRMPGLRDRLEDIEPNLTFELERYAQHAGKRVTFNKEARARFLTFATSPTARWTGNFRDLNAAVTRMSTLATGARISVDVVDEEIDRLKEQWRQPEVDAGRKSLEALLGAEAVLDLDRFDIPQLVEVVAVCRDSPTLSAAGRVLFAASRRRRKSVNDADRLRKYLARFDLTWRDLKD